MGALIQQRAVKVMQRIESLDQYSSDVSCLTRLYGTPAFVEARRQIADWMQEAGLTVWTDNIGNVHGKIYAQPAVTKTFVIGSHFDTVVNAGKYDGMLGVLTGIDIVAQWVGKSLPFNIEVVAFCEEEGVRFKAAYLGSTSLAGTFDPKLFDRKDVDGISLKNVIREMGGEPDKIKSDALPPEDWEGYFEIHIEQGPVLYEKNIPVGVVTSIAGQRRAEITFEGAAGHAGTVPMDMRHDALAGAAAFVLEVEKTALATAGLVGTVGRLQIANAATNVIPGEVVCSLDIRSGDENLLSEKYAFLNKKALEIADRRGLEVKWNLLHSSQPRQCDPFLIGQLEDAIKQEGFPLVRLVSGAGHDAVPIADVAKVSMLFVRDYKGISHNPLENVEMADLTAALQVGDAFLKKIMEK